MSKNTSLRNQIIYFSYHQERGHTIEDCRTLKDHLNQLEKARQLKEFMSHDRPQPQGD